MKKFRSHFVFSKGQQNGIFLLVGIIVVLQLVYFFLPFSSEEKLTTQEEEKLVRELQREVDSLKAVAASKRDAVNMAPFNPNFISDYKGYVLGMSVEEIDRLHAYREKDLWVNSSEEFQQVTGVSDSLLLQMAPLFKFPEWRQDISEKQPGPKKAIPEGVAKQDINTASAEDLQKINGIGEKLSARIVNYRQSIGGFRGGSQLKDVYGLSPEVVERLLQRFEVKSFPQQKASLNQIDLIPLAELPYFNYELARKVIGYREKNGKFRSFEELENIPGFPVEKIERIQLYLAID